MSNQNNEYWDEYIEATHSSILSRKKIKNFMCELRPIVSHPTLNFSYKKPSIRHRTHQ